MIELSGGIKKGAWFLTRNDGYVEILEVINFDKVLIKFIHPEWTTYVRATAIRSGMIKNHYKPSMCNKGYLGEGKYKRVNNGVKTPAYSSWCYMLNRVYAPDGQQLQNYYDVTVCEEWHNYQIFAEWYNNMLKTCDLNIDWEIDKDLIIPGNRCYHPEGCCLIPQAINSLIKIIPSKILNLPIGIRKHRKNYYAVCRKINHKRQTTGPWSSMFLAQVSYWEMKIDSIRYTTYLYKNHLPPTLYERLINFNWKDIRDYYGEVSYLQL